MYNIQTDNPAYAGSWGLMGFTAVGESQLLSKAFGASTYSLDVQSPIFIKNSGVGFRLENYHYGPLNNFSAAIDYSYMFRLNSNTNLRLGIRAQDSYYSFTDMIMVNQGETENLMAYDNMNTLRVGAGAFLGLENFYLGISAPELKGLTSGTDTLSFVSNRLILNGGYIATINKILDFIPSAKISYDFANNLMVDLNASFLLYNHIWLGAYYRVVPGTTIGATINFKVNNQLMVGYTYEHFTNSPGSAYRYNNHTLVLSYAVPWAFKRIASPRFF